MKRFSEEIFRDCINLERNFVGAEKQEKETLCLRVFVAKPKKEVNRYVVKFSEKNVLSCKVHKKGVSEHGRIKTNTNTTENS